MCIWEVMGDVVFWGGLGSEGVCCGGTVGEVLSLTILRCAVGELLSLTVLAWALCSDYAWKSRSVTRAFDRLYLVYVLIVT